MPLPLHAELRSPAEVMGLEAVAATFAAQAAHEAGADSQQGTQGTAARSAGTQDPSAGERGGGGGAQPPHRTCSG